VGSRVETLRLVAGCLQQEVVTRATDLETKAA